MVKLLRLRLLLLPLALALLPVPAAVAAEATPGALVGRLNAGLLEAMKSAESLGYEGRFALLAPLLDEVFDFPWMTRTSLGASWEKMDQGERDRLLRAFRDLSIANFAARFDGYEGERFEVGGERPGPRGSVLVENRLLRSSGEAIPINYLARRDGGSWRIVDVLLEGKYSELATRRAEYAAVIAGEGVEGLIRRLQQKLAELARA